MRLYICAVLLWLQFLTYPDWTTVAPGIEARNHIDVGKPAYDQCLWLANQSPWTCEIPRNQAIRNDVTARFQAFFNDLTAGNIVGPRALDVFLKYYDLRLTPAPPIVTPFGTIPPAPLPPTTPKPFGN